MREQRRRTMPIKPHKSTHSKSDRLANVPCLPIGQSLPWTMPNFTDYSLKIKNNP